MSKRRDHCMRLNGKAGETSASKKRWHKPDPRFKPSIGNALARLRSLHEKQKGTCRTHKWRGL